MRRSGRLLRQKAPVREYTTRFTLSSGKPEFLNWCPAWGFVPSPPSDTRTGVRFSCPSVYRSGVGCQASTVRPNGLAARPC